MKKFFHAVATLSGLIIGVGIFGVPFVVAQSGLGVGLIWIIVLGVVMLALHLLYGEVVTAAPGKHRLPGYAGHYLGKEWKRVVLITDVVRFWGLQVAYIIVGGTFLWLLLNPYFGGDPIFYSIILFGVASIVTFFGLRVVDRIEFYITWLLIGGILVIVGKGFQHFDVYNLAFSTGGNIFIPYGIIMVSLSGAAAIPGLWDIARKNIRVFRGAIIAGTLIPIIITALFAISVVGATGGFTSPEAVEGLQSVLGGRIVILGALTGFFAVITSYFVIALYLQEVLRYDFLVKRTPAWMFAVGVPLLLFLAGAKNFIQVIDVIGSILMGIEGMVIVILGVMAVRRRRAKARGLVALLGTMIILLLVTGVIFKLVDLI